MKKKISLFLTTLLLLTLCLPALASAADETYLEFNYNGLVSSAAAAGETYASGKNPSNNGAGTVNLRLPFVENAAIITSNILLAPVIDASYPFAANNMAKTIERSTPDWYADFAFNLKSTTYNGTYPVSFQASYQYDDGGVNISATQFFTVYVDVTGRPAPTEPSPSHAGSQPRVMVTKYTTDPATVMAGGSFTLAIEFTNQSKSEKVQNVKITLSNGGGEFLPADGTNAAYISSIGAGKTVDKVFHYSVSPEAQPRPATFNVDIVYENADAASLAESASLSIPVAQPIRIKLDDPQLYDTMAGEAIYISMNVYNLGKSPLYNLMATVEGTGLSAEQIYYGGNIEAGGTKTIELSVNADISTVNPDENPTENGTDIPSKEDGGVSILPILYEASTNKAVDGYFDDGSKGGYYDGGVTTSSVQMSGQIKITFEDAEGTEYTEYKDFTATIFTQTDTGYQPEIPVDEPELESVNLTWLWITLGVLVLAGGVVGIVLYKRNKNRIIEDELL